MSPKASRKPRSVIATYKKALAAIAVEECPRSLLNDGRGLTCIENSPLTKDIRGGPLSEYAVFNPAWCNICIASAVLRYRNGVLIKTYERALLTMADRPCHKISDPYNRGLTCEENVSLKHSIYEYALPADAKFDPIRWCSVCIAQTVRQIRIPRRHWVPRL